MTNTTYQQIERLRAAKQSLLETYSRAHSSTTHPVFMHVPQTSNKSSHCLYQRFEDKINQLQGAVA